MKTKFNILLIAFCLILFCFTGNVKAATSEQEFLNNYLPQKLEEYSSYPYVGYIITSNPNDNNYKYINVDIIYSNFESFNDIKPYIDGENVLGYPTLKYPAVKDIYYVVTLTFHIDNNVWNTVYTRNVKTEDITLGTGSIPNLVTTTIPIYKDGEIFFQVTPTVGPLAEVTLEQLEGTITTQMGTITIVAVSCLALLILLPLFWKALLRFLN